MVLSPRANRIAPFAPPPGNHRGSGFTLLELVVSLFLLALLVGGMSMSLGNGLSAWDRGKLRAERAQEVRVVMETLTRDLRSTVVAADRPLTTWFIGVDAGDDTGDFDELRLTCNSRPLNLYLGVDPTAETVTSPQTDLCEVAYWLESADSSTPGLIRREQSPPDEDSEEGGETETLSQWVTALNLRYYSQDEEEFVDEWETTEEDRQLPTAVEIQCTFASPDPESTALPLTYRTVVPILRQERSAEPDATTSPTQP